MRLFYAYKASQSGFQEIHNGYLPLPGVVLEPLPPELDDVPDPGEVEPDVPEPVPEDPGAPMLDVPPEPAVLPELDAPAP